MHIVQILFASLLSALQMLSSSLTESLLGFHGKSWSHATPSLVRFLPRPVWRSSARHVNKTYAGPLPRDSDHMRVCWQEATAEQWPPHIDSPTRASTHPDILQGVVQAYTYTATAFRLSSLLSCILTRTPSPHSLANNCVSVMRQWKHARLSARLPPLTPRCRRWQGRPLGSHLGPRHSSCPCPGHEACRSSEPPGWPGCCPGSRSSGRHLSRKLRPTALPPASGWR